VVEETAAHVNTVKTFIKEVRKAKTLQDERSVVQKESAAIRASFREESGDQNVRSVSSRLLPRDGTRSPAAMEQAS
jgi:hypothetical protein